MINLRGLKFKNRITISPMCQYSSKNGAPSEWHYHHLRNLIETGAGSLVIESTAISREGRITNKDLCLFNKKQMKEHSKLLDYLKKINNIPIILQISHSGRKGSAEVPFIKKNTSLKNKSKWQTYAPSAIRRQKDWPIPKELSKKKILKIIDSFKQTAKLAIEAGYDGIEIHMAHGYLIHQFCSPISNKRKDEYKYEGFDFKFPTEILKKIKKIVPKNKIVGARITGTDHLKKGLKVSDSIKLVKKLKQNGLDYICVSSGGIIPKTNMKFYSGYRLKIASKIKKSCKIITRTSGLIDSKRTIRKAKVKYKLDFVALGRILVKNKYFLIKNNLVDFQTNQKQYKYCL